MLLRNRSRLCPRCKRVHRYRCPKRPRGRLILVINGTSSRWIEFPRQHTATSPNAEPADSRDIELYSSSVVRMPKIKRVEEVENDIHEELSQMMVEVFSRDRDSFWVNDVDVDHQEWLTDLLATKPQAESRNSTRQGAIERMDYSIEEPADKTAIDWNEIYR